MADAVGEAVDVYREPDGPRYRQSTRFTGAAPVSPLAFPDVLVRLPDVFSWNAPRA